MLFAGQVVLCASVAVFALGASIPHVTIKNGTVVGSSTAGVDSFLGIPYAQPPIQNLRLRPPQPITKTFGTISATGVPTACPQFLTQIDTSSLPGKVVASLIDNPFLQNVTLQGEDCLTLNVQRPSGTNGSSNLPVLFWIYGGGFEFGSTQTYDASGLIQKSISLGQPIVYVAVNYRVGGFGFLAGKELSAEHSTNLGLRDQRLALQWVQNNIAAFGGDPTKVTIWGESAGSVSVCDQTIINGGDINYNDRPLFRSAIMDSGSVVPADVVTAPQAQQVYDTVVQRAGCAGSVDTLSCLRSVSYEIYLEAVNSLPSLLGYRSVDIAYSPRPDPSDNFLPQSPEILVANGKYAKIPIIIGDQEDEGTLFSLAQSNISTNTQFIEYLASYFPSDPNATAIAEGLLATYPDEPLLGQPSGSPFGTGPLNNIYPQYKRIAAVLGDLQFNLARRNYLNHVSSSMPSWSYLASYLYGTPVLGTFHASDIVYAYGLLGELEFPTNTIQTYYLNFVYSQTPNAFGSNSTLINWPQYSTRSPQLLNIQALNNTLLPDTYRLSSSSYIEKHISSFRI